MRVGFLLALVIAGPPLYGLAKGGELTGTAAIARGAIVAFVLVIGAALLMRLIDTFREQVLLEEREKARADALDRLAAARAKARDQENQPPK